MPRSRVLLTTALAMATSLVTVVGVGALPTANASVRASAGYTYTTLVQGTPDLIPGSCALNNLGQVAVVNNQRPDPASPWRAKLVRTDGSTVTLIAGADNGVGPGGTGLAINDSGQVAVGTGVKFVVGDGGALRTVARIGPGEAFSDTNFGLSLNDQGRVAFVGLTPSSGGIYTGNGSGPLATRYVNTDPWGNFGYIGEPVLNSAGQIAFQQNEAFVDGIYRAERDGTVTRLYQGPHKTSFVALGDMNRAGRVVFITSASPRLPREIYTVRGGPLTLVVSATDGFSVIASPSINDAGQVAFFAIPTTGGWSIYTGSRPSFAPVVRAGDVIGGREVSYVTPCNSMLNNGGQIAFRADFTDLTTAVVRADPVP
ncbi:MAG: choice-of-anchor tandem repeat NxxGxxAF-containing protein [Lapillicoccus sp.]